MTGNPLNFYSPNSSRFPGSIDCRPSGGLRSPLSSEDTSSQRLGDIHRRWPEMQKKSEQVAKRKGQWRTPVRFLLSKGSVGPLKIRERMQVYRNHARFIPRIAPSQCGSRNAGTITRKHVTISLFQPHLAWACQRYLVFILLIGRYQRFCKTPPI